MPTCTVVVTVLCLKFEPLLSLWRVTHIVEKPSTLGREAWSNAAVWVLFNASCLTLCASLLLKHCIWLSATRNHGEELGQALFEVAGVVDFDHIRTFGFVGFGAGQTALNT